MRCFLWHPRVVAVCFNCVGVSRGKKQGCADSFFLVGCKRTRMFAAILPYQGSDSYVSNISQTHPSFSPPVKVIMAWTPDSRGDPAGSRVCCKDMEPFWGEGGWIRGFLQTVDDYVGLWTGLVIRSGIQKLPVPSQS